MTLTNMKRYLLFYISILFSANCLSQANTWVQKTSLPAAARNGAVSFSINNKGYVGTGRDSTGNLLNDFWQYDPSIDTWKQVAAFAGSARINAVAFVVNGFGYVGTGYDGGSNLTDFYKYDPASNIWSQVDSMDKYSAAVGRREASSFSVGSQGYVVGGYDGTSNYNNETWKYDESDSITWTQMRVFPSNGRKWGVGFTIQQYGFAGMGYDYTSIYWNDLWKYDTLLNTWTQMANYPGSARGNAVAFTVGDNAFVGTGFDGVYKNNFFVYNYSANEWSQIADFSGGATSGAVAFSIGGNGYVCCGKDSVHYKNELWEYIADSTLGINNVDPPGFLMDIFPNPVKGELNIFFTSKTTSSYLILMDGSGRIVWVQYLGNIVEDTHRTISVKELAKGIYNLHLKTSATVITKSFIIE